MGPEVFELLHADRLERAIFQKGLGQTNGLVRKQDRLGDQFLVLVNLCQAVVPVEVLRLSQGQLLEDLFRPLELVGL